MGRTRINRKEQKGKSVATGGDPDAPTEADWHSMEKYRKFIVTENASDEEDDVEHLFEVGDCVSILPPDLPDGYGVEDGPAPPIEAMWLGIIKDIRMRYKNGEQEAWSCIQWFFSKEDVRSIIPSFDITHLGEYERLLSDHCDLIHSASLDDVVPIKRFYFHPSFLDIAVNNNETATSSSSVNTKNAALHLISNQKEIRTANRQTIRSMYPDIYYRYDFELKSKRITPKASHSTCFSPTERSKSSRSRLSSTSKSKKQSVPSATASIVDLNPQPNQETCLYDSLYSPPDSERAQKTGQQVAVLVHEAHEILEDGVDQILKFMSGLELPSNRVGGTTRTRSTAQGKRKRTGTSNSDSELSSLSSEVMDVKIDAIARQLAAKMQQAILLEDSLAMHVCLRGQCAAPRGSAWHRSCLTRNQVLSDEGVEKGLSGDVEGFLEDDETLQHLESSFLGNARRRGRYTGRKSP